MRGLIICSKCSTRTSTPLTPCHVTIGWRAYVQNGTGSDASKLQRVCSGPQQNPRLLLYGHYYWHVSYNAMRLGKNELVRLYR